MMMNSLRKLAVTALALGGLVLPARGADAQKDLPGPIDSLQDLQDSAKILFKLADDNNDNQISQQEAVDVGNLIVGGYFFRADKNGDGTVTKEEMREARDKALAQKPLLRALLTRAKTTDPQAVATARNAGQGILSLLDGNNDGQVQATEMKQMVQTTVQSAFAASDTNRDGQLSPSELNAAMAGAARAAVQAAFQTADADNNGQLSQAEYDKAIVQPANAVFHALDANSDGQISPQEMQTAERILANQLRRLNVPEPANSPRHLIESGRTPAEVAPVPNFGTPANRPATAPAQPRR
jgi:Ca2+-binding EF-hand superfamily protein